ncbi:MAG: hypothetical protein PVG65_00525 [Candidatus Thorarchaeota archaeon]|jgi:hypothetical protein
MYHSDFQKAKNSQGKYYRDQKTGDLKEYCMHLFVIYPKYSHTTEYYADFIPESCKRFDGFEGVCQCCGEVLIISAEDVVNNRDEMEKILQQSLKDDK